MTGSSTPTELEVLLEIFRSRDDLIRAYPEVVRGDLRGLLRWAITYGTTIDGAKSLLQPHVAAYRAELLRLFKESYRYPIRVEVSSSLFSHGNRPVIRWVKGDGKDDLVTRSAIAQSTRLFGDSVDYCLAINNISIARARQVLAWATQPVELFVQSPGDNPKLAQALREAGCSPKDYGYWWKWFPERLRPDGPEWILDGDMVVVRKPPWFDHWTTGRDLLRVSQIDQEDLACYGQYQGLISREKRLCSGLISIPPRLRYMSEMIMILRDQPLAHDHNGRQDMSEQGCVAAAFERLGAEPIPQYEFPYARAFESNVDYGFRGRQVDPWGYHFGWAFRMENPHFHALVEAGEIFWRNEEPTTIERFSWMRNNGQWGVEGWSMAPEFVHLLSKISTSHAGKRVLDIGTSRGLLSAIMNNNGCKVTTLDRVDRGASRNLRELNVEVRIKDAIEYLHTASATFSLIALDLHGNETRVWKKLWPLLTTHLDADGQLFLYNSHLWKIPEYANQTGLKWVLETQLDGWEVNIYDSPLPGAIVCRPRVGRREDSSFHN